MPQALIKITQALGVRVLIVQEPGLTDAEILKDIPSIRIIGSTSFHKLFPCVKAVIHHGGCGTTFECLRAGKPFFAVHVMYPIGDQMFWGKLAYRQHFAVKPVRMKNLTEQILFERIVELYNSDDLYDNAIRFSQEISTEKGLDNAIRIIETK